MKKLRHIGLTAALLVLVAAGMGKIVTAAADAPIATGTFIQADPADTLHWGKGSLNAYADRVEINADFEVPLGPKYHVYLMRSAEIKSPDDVSIGSLIDLGRLRHFKGAQTVPIPRGIDLKNWGSIIIYCEGFQTLITPASLKFN